MKYLTILMALALPLSANIIGLNDNSGPAPGNDFDYNDAEYSTTGLSFHTFAPFTFTAPPGYTEFPFPQPAYYFDYAISDGSPVTILNFGGQTSGHDVLQLSNDNWLTWVNVGTSLTATMPAGTRVDFRLDVNDGAAVLYADPARNADHHGNAVLYDPGSPFGGTDAPEPGSWALAATGLGLAIIGWKKRAR